MFATWHVTCDTLQVGEVNLLLKCQLLSSYGLRNAGFLKIFLQRVINWLSKSINNKAVFRTALATPGLLIKPGKNIYF